MQNAFRWLGRLACRRSRGLLLISAFITALCVYPVYRLTHRLETDFAALLPADFPSVRALEQIKKQVRGTENLIALVECEDFASATRFADDLARQLESQTYQAYIKYVDYQRDVEFFERNALLYMDLGDLEEIEQRIADRIEQEKLRRSPLYIPLDDDEESGGKMDFADLRAKYEKPGMRERYYTNPKHTLVALTVAAAGTTSTYWTVGNLNTITGFLFVILFGLGIDFGIHLFARYLEDRMAGMDVPQAVEQMLAQTGRAMLTAGLTTVAAFYALTITDFKGFSEFGFIVGTGIITSMVAMVTVLPAFLVLADRDLGLVRMKPVWGHRVAGDRGRFPLAWPLLVAGTGVTVLMAWNLGQVGFEYDFDKLRANLPASRAIKQKVDAALGSGGLSKSPGVVLAGNKEELDEVVAAVEVRIAAADSTPTIEAVRTLWSALPAQQEEKLGRIARIRRQVDSAAGLLADEQRTRLDELRPMLEVRRLEVEDLPLGIRRKFSTIDGGLAYFAFIYPRVALRDGRNAMAFADDAEAIRTPSGKTFFASSSSIIFADMLRVMLRDSRTAVLVTGLAVVLIVLADFRSLGRALLVLLPLGCGLVWMVGSMYLLHIELNLYNMVVVPSIIGMGIDNGVHLYHRYQEEGPGSLAKVLRHTGGAMSICLLTTMVGFGGLVTARHPGLNSIGVLALIGLVACFLAAVTVLPALLQVLEDRAKKRNRAPEKMEVV